MAGAPPGYILGMHPMAYAQPAQPAAPVKQAPPQPQVPSYMSEEKLQEKGMLSDYLAITLFVDLYVTL